MAADVIERIDCLFHGAAAAAAHADAAPAAAAGTGKVEKEVGPTHTERMVSLEHFIDDEIAHRVAAANMTWRKLEVCFKWQAIREYMRARGVDREATPDDFEAVRDLVRRGELTSVEYDPKARVVLRLNHDQDPMSYSFGRMEQGLTPEELKRRDRTLFRGCMIDDDKGIGFVVKSLDLGACPDSEDEMRFTPLIHAVTADNILVCRALIARGAKVDKSDPRGQTPLHTACQVGSKRLVELLLSEGARIDVAMEDGTLPLHVACYDGRLEIAELLLDSGSDVNRATCDGHTPLSAATKRRHADLCKLLLSHGAELGRSADLKRSAAASFVEDIRAELAEAEEAAQAQAAEAAQAAARRCETCGVVSLKGGPLQLLKCQGCHVAWYCDRACQRADWSDHRTPCRIEKARRAAEAEAVAPRLA